MTYTIPNSRFEVELILGSCDNLQLLAGDREHPYWSEKSMVAAIAIFIATLMIED